MGFNTTFNNISVILWQSFLLIEETGVPEENQQSVTNHLTNVIKGNKHLELQFVK